MKGLMKDELVTTGGGFGDGGKRKESSGRIDCFYNETEDFQRCRSQKSKLESKNAKASRFRNRPSSLRILFCRRKGLMLKAILLFLFFNRLL